MSDSFITFASFNRHLLARQVEAHVGQVVCQLRCGRNRFTHGRTERQKSLLQIAGPTFT